MKAILPVKKLLGLVEMTSGLVNASFTLPEWKAVKMIFFAPWGVSYKFFIISEHLLHKRHLFERGHELDYLQFMVANPK